MKKRSIRKRLISIAVVVIVLAALAAVLVNYGRRAAEAAIPVTRTTEVAYGKLTLSIASSGTVQSGNAYNVYSALTYRVDEILVQEGQFVRQGEILAQLDTESLEMDIRQQTVNLGSTEINTELDINSKLRAYEDAQERTALSVSNSRRSYELLASQVERGVYPELVSAQTTLDNAKDSLSNAEQDLDNKKTTYDNNLFLFDLGELSRQALDNSLTALEASQRAFDSANRAYDVAATNQQNLLDRVNNDVETSRRNYESTRISAEQEVDNARRLYESAVASSSTESARINLEKLEKQLRDATITAPISGTVTKVYAKEGNPGNGLLFIIEDLQSLEIATKVKEYDVAGINTGMTVLIRSDATGERDILGTVKSIAPTSEKTSAGTTILSNVVEYETIVTVDEPDSGLKIGMNTRMSIVQEEKENVLYVPYDAVIESVDGTFRLFLVDEFTSDDKTTYSARSVPVTVGLETDFFVEISGDGVSEGRLIVSEPFSVTEGAEVKIN